MKLLKNFTTTVYILAVLSLLSISTKLSAQDFTSGTGIEDDPYIVSSAGQLDNIRNIPAAHYKLGADIDLTEWITTNSPTTGWNPIGTSAAPFAGSLDGDGHIITNIWADKEESNIGLFGLIAGHSTIKNLGVTVDKKKKMKGTENVSIIAGALTNTNGTHNCLFEQIYAEGVIEATTKNIGGIVGGNNWMHVTIKDCYVKGTINSAGNATAGIMGNSYGAITLIIDNCYSMTKIKCDDGAVAGILGAVSASSTENLNASISNCLAIGPITTTSTSVGRICGWVKDEKITLTDNMGFDAMTINDKIVSSSSGSSRHGQDKSKEELVLPGTYATWDFTSVWDMGNQAYQLPVLKNVSLSMQPTEEADLSYASDNPFINLVDENGTLNILDCGVAANGRTDDTEIIQLAINACAAKKATLTFPANRYAIRPLFMKSNLTLELQEGAILMGSTRLQDYKDAFPTAGAIETSALIYGRDVMNVKITGKGKIDGRGGTTEFQLGNSAPGRPKLVHFIRSENITLENVELTNSAFWTVHFLLCDGVKISGIRLLSHANWNNDGLDIDSRNVEIENCYIDCDDDGICMKSDRGIPCENVTVKNCTIQTNCSAIKFGTAGKSGFKNISYSDIVIIKATQDNFRKHHLNGKLSWMGINSNPTAIAGIALESVDGGILDEVTITNVKMEDVQTAIFLRLGDRDRVGGNMSQLKNVTISGLQAKTNSKLASIITGVPGGIIENVLIKDVEITLPGGGTSAEANQTVPEKESEYPEANMFDRVLPAHGFYVRHAKGIRFENVKFNLEKEDARPPYVFDDVTDYEVESGLFTPEYDNNLTIHQTDGKLYVSPGITGPVKIQLINLSGSVLHSLITVVDSENAAIALNAPEKGIYIMSMQSSQGNYSGKVIVK